MLSYIYGLKISFLCTINSMNDLCNRPILHMLDFSHIGLSIFGDNWYFRGGTLQIIWASRLRTKLKILQHQKGSFTHGKPCLVLICLAVSDVLTKRKCIQRAKLNPTKFHCFNIIMIKLNIIILSRFTVMVILSMWIKVWWFGITPADWPIWITVSKKI